MIGRLSDPVEVEKPGSLVLGDSRLTFDFARNDIDVAFTGIRSDNNEAYADITWNNIPVQNGAFYGPGHEEVGGDLRAQQPHRGVWGESAVKEAGTRRSRIRVSLRQPEEPVQS